MSGLRRSVDVHSFAMSPRMDIPRSAFNMQRNHKATFDAGYIVPVMLEEVLPGDSVRVSMTAFSRLATPIFPLMDNLWLDSFFFFVPNRLVWDNWVRFMGQQDNPASSISYVVPTVTINGGYAVGSLQDHFGLGVTGQVTAANWSHSTLPLRGYNLIWNEWFRDENLQNSVTVRKTDSGDLTGDFSLLRRGKRHDYFTSCLPWPQKGGVAVAMPLGTSAPVKSDGTQISLRGASGAMGTLQTTGVNGSNITMGGATGAGALNFGAAGASTTGLYADLSAATGATINALRTSFQIQRLLERDARGGTRYAEIVFNHFGVRSPDGRLQRPEYLGGSSTPMQITPIAQTSASNITGGSTPLGNLAAFGTGVHRSGFSAAFTEHGYLFGLVNVRADLTYQQGLRRHWSRSTRYDFYMPVFANLGEQTVLNREIYMDASANDASVFGYQERWAEYRYSPSSVAGLFRSTAAGTMDAWHLAQRFTSVPVLGDTFIQESPPVSRILAVGAGANGAQILFDSFFDMRWVRPMPMYSVPGMIDHF